MCCYGNTDYCFYENKLWNYENKIWNCVILFIIIIIHFVLLVYFLFSKNMFSIIYVIPAILYKNSILSVILSCIFWYLGIKNFWELH